MCINSNREFVHLHVHTDYSIGDSICSIYKKNRKNSDLVKMAQRYKMSAMAITDHQSIGGAIEFYKMMNSNAVKPIIGCEINIASSLHKPIGGVKQKSFHLVLLAKDFYGYQNLCKLTSAANLSPKAELSKELLSKHSKGLIGLSGCIHGEIPFLVFNDELRLAKSSLNDYIDIFGKENFYLELMNHRLPEQPMINSQLIKIGKEFNVPPVATNNVHYLEKEHAEIREIYASICCKTKVKLPTKEFYLKSGDEMHELFKEVPESISNTLAIAERCNLTIPLVPYVNHYPVYKIKTGKSEKDFLRNICLNNMLNRYGFDPEKLNKLNAKQQQTIDRIEFELNTIDSSRYCNYFLIVWDFLKYARNIGITVGPGGGYGAGSIVAYLTYITDLDPLRYGLLFREPVYREHIPPDFWIRLCGNRSKEVIEYVRNKYGTNCVAQIESYRKLSIIDVINDVRKVFGESFIKENQGKISRYSEILEGLNRNTYIFSDEEIIIGDQQLDSLTPVNKNSKNELCNGGNFLNSFYKCEISF